MNLTATGAWRFPFWMRMDIPKTSDGPDVFNYLQDLWLLRQLQGFEPQSTAIEMRGNDE